MKSSSILTTTALALALAAAPTTAGALDLGDTVSKTTKSVSKATRSVTDSVSRSVGSTAKSVSSTTKSVGSTTKSLTSSTTRSVTSTTRSLTSATTSVIGTAVSGGSGGIDGGSADSGDSVGVLSNYQLISLGLASNPPVSDMDGKQPTTVTPDYVRALVAGLDRIEKQEFKVRCARVLRSPKAYDSELIRLCQILQAI